MWIEPLLLGVFGVVTVIAIAVAWRATVRARTVQARLLAMQLEHPVVVEPDGRSDPSDDREALARRTGTSLEPAPAGHEPTAKVRVLVVEDEPGIREFIERTLTRAGREVVTVVGPQAALAALHNSPEIALMLADIVMPEMDGYDLAIEARKIAPAIRVVFMSAFARDPDRHSGGEGFLSKPFTSESLVAFVDDALTL